MTIPLRLEAGEEVRTECMAADVYFGDEKLKSEAVRAEVMAGEGSERILRVSTTALINEPIVTVYLAAGCKARITRKIIALADPPSLAQTMPGEERSLDGAGTVLPSAAPNLPDVALAEGRPQTALPRTEASARRARKGSRAAAPSVVLNGVVASNEGVDDAIDGRADQPTGTRDQANSNKAPKANKARRADARPAEQAAPSVQADGAQQAATENKVRRSGKPTGPRLTPDSRQASQDGARLMLDPIEADAMFAPSLRMTPSLGAVPQPDAASPDTASRRAAAAALWRAMNATPEQMARDSQRLQELEQRLAQLRQEGEQSRQSVLTLQAQAREKAPGVTGRWSYLAALLAVVGLGSSGYLFWRLRREQQRREEWWQSSQDGGDAQAGSTGDGPDFDRTSVEFVHVPGSEERSRAKADAAASPSLAPDASLLHSTPGYSSNARGGPPSPAQSGRAGVGAREPLSTRPLGADAFHRHQPDHALDTAPATLQVTALSAASSEPLREVSVEELIDLEQQAEFFIVLGQDEAAIDLLEGHVQSTTGASPLPFLKLLEVYRRVGRRADYERVQTAFNQRFNAYAPSWEADLAHGHTLEDYVGVVERLQSLWPSPTKAMAVLETSLTRPDSGDETFDLPAYRELLFLYAVARDLAERHPADPAGVDLLLPEVDAAGPQPGAVSEDEVHRIIEPLMATRPIKAQPDVSPSLSLDLELEDMAPRPKRDDDPLQH